MKKILLYLFCFLECGCSQISYCQCGGAALLIPKKQEVSILDKPGGRIIATIMDDPDSDYYNLLQVTRIKRDYALVEVSVADEERVLHTGWIELKNIGIKPNSYSDDLMLYAKPDVRSKVISVIHNPYWTFYNIVKCDKGWFYVTYELHGCLYQGWMPPNRQCANPFSPCN